MMEMMETMLQVKSPQMSGFNVDRNVRNGWRASSASVAADKAGGGGVRGAAITDKSPTKKCKRDRLSRLLDRLTFQLRSDRDPPAAAAAAWLALTSPTSLTMEEEAPLDLSVRGGGSTTPKAEEHQHHERHVRNERHECQDCGQAFAVADRLAKHVACRHRPRQQPHAAPTTRAFQCQVCNRRFARSDMLTRHARLHTGLKPYACLLCGQVFSRSDHLATHQRTHTGEKPYRCPACPYAACRRDMITRHMRIHRRPQPPLAVTS